MWAAYKVWLVTSGYKNIISYRTIEQLLEHIKTFKIEFVLERLPLKFSGSPMNLRHTSFSWKQWCCSAKANVVATVFMATSSQSLASQSNLSLSRAYRSAAASRCWAIRVEAHLEFRPKRSCISGRASQYIKWSKTCKHPTHNENRTIIFKQASLFALQFL